MSRREAIRYQNQQAKTGGKIPSMAEAFAAIEKKKADDALKPAATLSRKQINTAKGI